LTILTPNNSIVAEHLALLQKFGHGFDLTRTCRYRPPPGEAILRLICVSFTNHSTITVG